MSRKNSLIFGNNCPIYKLVTRDGWLAKSKEKSDHQTTCMIKIYRIGTGVIDQNNHQWSISTTKNPATQA